MIVCQYSNILCCFIKQEKRLRNRKTETEDTIQRRLNIAKADLEYGMTIHQHPDRIKTL